MSTKVILEEGGSVNVHIRIKDLCKKARSRLGLTNQNISTMISERFGIEDFSVNTVNNFFSERSKASTIYTTGYICAVLDISIDDIFGIERGYSSEQEAEYIRQLAEIKTELRLKEQEIQHLKETIEEKNVRLDQAQKAIDHYRQESSIQNKRIQPWIFTVVLVLLICSVVFIIAYLAIFDIGNPDYGFFRAQYMNSPSAFPEPSSIGLIFKNICC